VDIPETRYARSGDVNIAYQVVGDGPFDVVLIPPSVTHVELDWELARYARTLRAFAEFARLIVFDKRGIGMSDRVTSSTTFEQRMDDIRAVMDAAGSERAALYGLSEGGPMALLFAATYPARAWAIAVYGGVVRELWAPDFPFGSRVDDLDKDVAEFAASWAKPDEHTERARRALPDADEAELAAFVRLTRYGATPGAAADFARLNAAIDVRPALSAVRAPTLILHKTHDPWVPVEHGRFAAEHIAGARFVELPGDTHINLAHEGELIVREVRTFFEEVWAGAWSAPEPDRVLATVLFTDIVGSTAKAAELGDRGWRDLLERHHAAVRRELSRYRGREIDTAGDGFFASFDGPARAIRCACAINDSVRRFGLELRAGLHTGECELLDGKVAGIAVNIGARVAAQAAPGEVLVSQTVKDLVAGSGLTFEDRGAAELKGVPGEWRLYAVADAAA
jgi:class 3 adenylate cyclase/dienelactone hydrolase